MKLTDKTYDQERALYGSKDIELENCRFEGPADGESALKESENVSVKNSYFALRYPFWHDTNLAIDNCELTPDCRAAIWYSKHVEITNTLLNGIKAVRECENVIMKNCKAVSPEFGWSTRAINMENCQIESEYFMLRSERLTFKNVKLVGKYSFQYIIDSTFDDCEFDTKDAFWHARNVTVRNSLIKGEYLAWYSDGVTFENCTIIGTQPLCYCKNLKLINCKMIDTDLAFERSQVEAVLTAPIISIKNPLAGTIRVPAARKVIMDLDEARGKVIIG